MEVESPTPRRSFKNVKWQAIADDINNSVPDDIPTYWSQQKLETACRSLTVALESSLDNHAPLKPPARRYEYWWTPECATAKRKYHKAAKLAHKNNTTKNHVEARKALHSYQKVVWDAKKISWQTFIQEVDSISDMSKVNKIMRRMNESPVEFGLVKNSHGQLAESKQESLEWMMEEHFPNSTLITDWKDGPEPDKLRHIQLKMYPWLTRERFRHAVNHFGNGKAPGPDGFRAEMLQRISNRAIDYILTLFNASIQLNYVPSDWRRTSVLFPAKPNKTDHTARNSFRPISLMSNLFKTLERLSFWDMEENALRMNPLHDNQFGFRRGKSTDHALSDIVNYIEKGTQKGDYVLACMMDIKGAFSCLTTDAIITAMKDRGINTDVVEWYRNFLNTRTVESSLGNARATVRTGAGCPQGGVNSGLLWNLAIDRLLEQYTTEGKNFHTAQNRGVKAKSFVDDTTLLTTGTDLGTMYNNMQNALNCAQRWAEDCGLTFCPNKCNAILFTNKTKLPTLPQLKIHGQLIPQVDTTRLLGVLLDSKLSWKPHINDKIKKCKAALMHLRSIINKHWSPKPQHLRWIYTSVVVPILTHACLVWERITD